MPRRRGRKYWRGWPMAKRSPGVGRRHALDLGSRLQTGARSERSRPYGDCIAGRHPPFLPRCRSRHCRPTASFSRASCRPNKARGKSASPRSRLSPRRSCCSRADRASPRRSPILPARLGARAAAICRELTKLHEEIRRGDLTNAGARLCQRTPRHAANSSSSSRRPSKR